VEKVVATYINPSLRFTFNISTPPPPPNCASTPTVTGGNNISLTSVYRSTLQSTGNTANLKELNFKFSSCQSLTRIRYSVESYSGSSPNSSQGLLYTTRNSSESAYVFQVVRKPASSWVPVSLGTSYDFNTTSSSPSMNGVLGVRWYRKSGGSTTAGTRNASMRITFTYQ